MTVNDLGNNGSGDPLEDSKTIEITVLPDTITLPDDDATFTYTLGDDIDVVVGGAGDDTVTLNAPSNDVEITDENDRLLIDVDGDDDTDLTVSGVEDLVINAANVVLSGDFSDTGLSTNTITYAG